MRVITLFSPLFSYNTIDTVTELLIVFQGAPNEKIPSLRVSDWIRKCLNPFCNVLHRRFNKNANEILTVGLFAGNWFTRVRVQVNRVLWQAKWFAAILVDSQRNLIVWSSDMHFIIIIDNIMQLYREPHVVTLHDEEPSEASAELTFYSGFVYDSSIWPLCTPRFNKIH